MAKVFKDLVKGLGFLPKDGAVGVYSKKYKQHNDYCIDIDFTNEKIYYGDIIASDYKTTQNFSQDENWVVLECVDRLLEKGYKPQNIVLEKTWAAGHGTSGRLDICVTRDDGSEYLLIECKTFGKEFDKAVAKMCKDGGQLFTYFKFSNKADVIMLYASELQGNKIIYKNEIVKIEDDYRIGDVKDFYEKWNKLPKDNGIFENWVKPYCFESKALIKSQLKPINQEDSSFIFNRFLEILRHNVVSDKGNAFNKIFTLFLCKVYDETTKQDDEELDFQWKEGVDDNVSFQLRLTDLYKKGMELFLSRTVSDFNEEEFEHKYKSIDENIKQALIKEINKLRLEKNNEFAIKEVYDSDSFTENAKIVKEVVELLQGYRIRYNKRQQYLSDFFELLLTTGLKQEAGQFFTPVPIAQFIIKSLPLDKIVDKTLKSKEGDLLPYMIDYAAGSGHFITEYMHEVQNIINQKEPSKYIDRTSKKIKNWKDDQYDWATEYVYGVEKDYRLVKVGKVGCYLHGDGLANVILSDGLGNFVNTKDYKGRLRKSCDDGSKDNQQFDILLSNPPYSVAAFINTTRDYYTEKDFELYDKLTDNSSEIECLFVERTKQLLKDGGVAGVILPSSILTNSGIYTKTRELILKYFEIVAITELGSNTFMATGTNTVVLFLRRRNNYECINLQKDVDKFFKDFKDVTINNIETPVSKYVNHVWEGLAFDDYVTLLEQNPDDKVKTHDLFKEYSQKINHKTEKEFWNKVLELEKEKIYYFILAYPQKLVVVKTGEKDAEKQFLGYEFSFKRGNEGIHAILKDKNIDECTKLFDINNFDNPQKASTYIYRAFENDFDSSIDETLKNNIIRINLLDMMTFDRADFEKVINVKAKKKIEIETKWDNKNLKEISNIEYGTRIVKKKAQGDKYPVYGGGGETFRTNSFNRSSQFVISRFGMSSKCVRFVDGDFYLNDSGLTISSKFEENVLSKYLNLYLYLNQELVYSCGRGVAQKNIDMNAFNAIPIPLPPLEIQQKIVDEIETIEKNNKELTQNVRNINQKIQKIIANVYSNYTLQKLAKYTENPQYGANVKAINGNPNTDYRYIRITDIDDNGKLLSDWKTAEKIEQKYVLQDGDFLFARSGATAGKTFYYTKETCPKAIFAGYLIRFKCKAELKPKFLNILCKSDIYKKWAENIRGGAAQPNINAQQFSNYEIPVPPVKDQQKIVSQIEELEKQIAQAQAIIDNSKQQKQEILDKYLK